ncbi:MAG: alpha/beta hydrolase [Chloroflexi bacterium]|nr:alpha/beta hydrolase [Chloroflexota bacterium]
MSTVTSRDGTTIAFEQVGGGPPLILVDGALGYRELYGSRPIAEALSGAFTAIAYDRRGRGESSDTSPFGLEREIEDIEALIDAAGGSAYLFGASSGAALAFEAALALGEGRVRGLAMYEPPYNDEPAARKAWRNYRRELRETLAAGRPGDAVGLFMVLLGMPPEQLAGMQQDPFWPQFQALGHTLEYDAAALGEEAALPSERAARLAVPTLVMDGGATEWSFLHTTAVALAQAIPHAEHHTLEGQTHEVEPEALLPVLREFFLREATAGGARR